MPIDRIEKITDFRELKGYDRPVADIHPNPEDIDRTDVHLTYRMSVAAGFIAQLRAGEGLFRPSLGPLKYRWSLFTDSNPDRMILQYFGPIRLVTSENIPPNENI